MIERSLVRIPAEAHISGWTHTLNFVSRCHLMSFIEKNFVDTDMSQVRPECAVKPTFISFSITASNSPHSK